MNTILIPIVIPLLTLLSKFINLLNITIIWIVTFIILFQNIRIIFLGQDISHYSTFVIITMLLLSGVMTYLAWIFKPTTKAHIGLLLASILGLSFIAYTLYSLITWFTITDEGMITYKALTLVKVASYEVKLAAYTTHLETLINHITNVEFREFLINTYGIYIKKPTTAIQQTPLSNMLLLANAEIAKALATYNQMLEIANSINQNSLFTKLKPYIIGVSVILVGGIAIYLAYNYFNYDPSKVKSTLDTIKETAKSVKTNAELQIETDITLARLATEQQELAITTVNGFKAIDSMIATVKGVTKDLADKSDILAAKVALNAGILNTVETTLNAMVINPMEEITTIKQSIELLSQNFIQFQEKIGTQMIAMGITIESLRSATQANYLTFLPLLNSSYPTEKALQFLKNLGLYKQ